VSEYDAGQENPGQENPGQDDPGQDAPGETPTADEGGTAWSAGGARGPGDSGPSAWATGPWGPAPAWPPPPPPAGAGWGTGTGTGTGPGTAPGAGGGWSGNWGIGSAAAPPAPPQPPRRHRVLPALLSLVLVGAAATTGVAIGHEVWPAKTTVSSAAQGGVTSPNSSGSSGSTGLGSGSTGSGSGSASNPYGSYSGQSPFGSGTFGGSGEGDGSGGSAANGSGTQGSSGPSDTAAIAAKVDPALVDINSTFTYQSAQGAGTGIVLTSTGEILTNNHVIEGATKISVTDVGNGQTYSATVVGYDASQDVAVLQLKDASGLQTARLGNSSAAAVGESVVAIGNAGGTGGSPTSAGGSITALDQSITASDDLDGANEQLSGLIQINADVQPGDSGGSLVNTAGQVIGMDTAASEEFSFQSSGSEGFAIPIDQALAIAQEITSGQGSTTVHVGATAFLGVLISGSGDQGSPSGFGGSSTSGVVIGSVVSGAAAQQAGLTEGDVITSLGGQSVDSASALSALLVSHHPGDRVQLGWVDSSGQSHTATVALSSGPPA